MASWIHSLLCLMPAPIHSDAVFAPANKYSDTMTKGEHDDEKLLNYTSVFWWDIFKTFTPRPQLQSNSPISASLLPSPPHFELRCVCLTNISPPISSTPAPFMFLHPTTRHSLRMVLVCLPPPAVFRGTVCECCVFTCATMEGTGLDG